MNTMLLDAAPQQGAGGGTVMIIYVVLIIAFFYFFMIRPQKKQEKQTAAMRNSLEIGDEVTTIGGVVGRGSHIKEDIVTIETGADRVKMRFQRWAIQVTKKTENVIKEAPELKEDNK